MPVHAVIPGPPTPCISCGVMFQPVAVRFTKTRRGKTLCPRCTKIEKQRKKGKKNS